MIGNSAVSAVYIGSSKIYPSGGTVDYSKQYLTFEVVDGGNITITASNADVTKTIQYSTDNGSTWTSLTTSTTAQELGGALSVGDKVLVKGTNTAYGTSSYYNSFGGTAKVNVYGNIMSLISGDSFANSKTLTDSYTFYRLFYAYTNLLSAENLILTATTLTSHCYYGMFRGCTSLVTAPTLPATTLANFCYSNMFQYCTNLVNAPELPATTLADYCYEGMFYGCTSLTSAPELPATTLAERCYEYMFYGCTSLVTAPELPATTLTTDCYQYMFNGCSLLNYIKAMFTTTPGTDYTSNWVNGVASSGTFVKNSAATWNVTGVDGIPNGWTPVTE